MGVIQGPNAADSFAIDATEWGRLTRLLPLMAFSLRATFYSTPSVRKTFEMFYKSLERHRIKSETSGSEETEEGKGFVLQRAQHGSMNNAVACVMSTFGAKP
jgi:hypothetical protein